MLGTSQFDQAVAVLRRKWHEQSVHAVLVPHNAGANVVAKWVCKSIHPVDRFSP